MFCTSRLCSDSLSAFDRNFTSFTMPWNLCLMRICIINLIPYDISRIFPTKQLCCSLFIPGISYYQIMLLTQEFFCVIYSLIHRHPNLLLASFSDRSVDVSSLMITPFPAWCKISLISS